MAQTKVHSYIKVHTLLCVKNCNTKKETCDRNEMFPTWSVIMWFYYGMQHPCAAIGVSMRCGMEWKWPWISSWRMSLHAVCMRVHKASRVGAGGPWQISRRPTIPQVCSMGDMSGERAGQGSSNTRRLWMKACTILATCGLALSFWNMACVVTWSKDST